MPKEKIISLLQINLVAIYSLPFPPILKTLTRAQFKGYTDG